jgi:hypothetical protein
VGTDDDGEMPRAQGDFVHELCLDDEPVAHIAREAMNKPRRVITGGVPVRKITKPSKECHAECQAEK